MPAANGGGSSGKSPNAGGKSGASSNGGSGSSSVSPPNQVTLAAPASVTSSTSPSTPFAWIDTANLIAPGAVWIGISTVRWQNAGANQVSFPVVDAAIGMTPRFQIGASVPRIVASDALSQPGGLGTTFFNAKFGILNGSERSLKVAVAPTLEVLSEAARQFAPIEHSRVHWGLPFSAEFDRGVSRAVRLDRLLLAGRVVHRRWRWHAGWPACWPRCVIQPLVEPVSAGRSDDRRAPASRHLHGCVVGSDAEDGRVRFGRPDVRHCGAIRSWNHGQRWSISDGQSDGLHTIARSILLPGKFERMTTTDARDARDVAVLSPTSEVPILFAQNLVEHGSLDSIASNLQRSTDTVGTWLTNVSPTTWIVLAVVIVIGVVIWSRR